MLLINKNTKNLSSYSAAMADIYRDSFTSSRPWSIEEMNSLLQEKGTFGFLEPNKAMIICNIVAGESEIYTICVLPDYRRQGYASRLLEEAITFAQNNEVQTMFLEVNSNNIAAQELYRKYGFVSVGIRKKYYDNGQSDGITMSKNLLL